MTKQIKWLTAWSHNPIKNREVSENPEGIIEALMFENWPKHIQKLKGILINIYNPCKN